MQIKPLGKVRRRLFNVADNLKWCFKTSSQESVYFYTFHKCASSLFSAYVLRNIAGLRHVDYASCIYQGKRPKKIEFRAIGSVYGPIRLSVDRMSPVYERLVAPASTTEFVRDRIAIFLVRDPRDILVSAYYSFGYTHGFSRVREIHKRQEIIQRQIQEKTVDEYVLDSVNATLRNFELVRELADACERSTILKYEDMIDNFGYFTHQLTRHINLDDRVIQDIYERSRPKQTINRSSHRRSGRPGGFRNTLETPTITVLNEKLAGTLERFQYEV